MVRSGRSSGSPAGTTGAQRTCTRSSGAPGYRAVTTHIFDSANEYNDSDAVFGVRGSLIQEFRPAGPADPPGVAYVVDVDFALAASLGVN